jgi:hypothetical protein
MTNFEDARERALRYHCRLAAECAHPRFSFPYECGSIVLTVNSGYE